MNIRDYCLSLFDEAPQAPQFTPEGWFEPPADRLCKPLFERLPTHSVQQTDYFRDHAIPSWPMTPLTVQHTKQTQNRHGSLD